MHEKKNRIEKEEDRRQTELQEMAHESGGLILANGSLWKGNDRRSTSKEGKKAKERILRLLPEKRAPSLFFG